MLGLCWSVLVCGYGLGGGGWVGDGGKRVKVGRGVDGDQEGGYQTHD